MNPVYDIRTDTKRTPLVQRKIKKGNSKYRTKFGLYGTDEWLNNLRSEGLVITIEGVISDNINSGHNDFPEFKVNTDNASYQFERLGLEEIYIIGRRVKIQATKSMNVYPISGLENSLTPLIIEIEE